MSDAKKECVFCELASGQLKENPKLGFILSFEMGKAASKVDRAPPVCDECAILVGATSGMVSAMLSLGTAQK